MGKTWPLELNLQYRRHLNNNANKYLDSDHAFSNSSQFAEKKNLLLYLGLQRSLVYMFSLFRQRKGAHPMYIRHKLSSLVASCKMEKTSIILITSEELAKGLFRLTSPPKGHDTRSGNQTSLEGSIFLFPFNTNNFRTFASILYTQSSSHTLLIYQREKQLLFVEKTTQNQHTNTHNQATSP